MTTVLAWEEDRKRSTSIVVLVVALVVLAGSFALWWFADASVPSWAYWVLVGILALVLLFMAALLFLKPRAPKAAAAESASMSTLMGESAPAAEATAEAPPAAPAYEPRVLTLRCGDCGTIFDVTDTGERPLYHTCPGCGAEGALRDPVEAAPAAEAEAPAAPAMPEPEPAPVMTPAPAPVATPAPAVKRIKLRCGGCKEVFAIEDTGERPLKRACPHCGRMGQIN